MARYTLDRAAIARVAIDPAVTSKIDDLAHKILDEAEGNIVHMGAVDTGQLYRSGFTEHEADTTRIGFQVDYSTYVHEGEGGDRYIGPRPFLAEAALKNRGRI